MGAQLHLLVTQWEAVSLTALGILLGWGAIPLFLRKALLLLWVLSKDAGLSEGFLREVHD